MKLHSLSLRAAALVWTSVTKAEITLTLNPRDPGRVFDGIGAVSAGASTRLLPDYPEPQRSEVLDFLFRPKFGAGFQHLKVEIGSGENSTCGSEPTHALTREELAAPRPRGYEFWLMAEARRRNPRILLDCLAWAYPHWIAHRFSQDSADWIVSFLEVARQQYGLELNWLAAGQNEHGTDPEWIKHALRPSLDRHGFRNVKLQAPDDDSAYWQIFDQLEKDSDLSHVVKAVGYHYVDGREPWEIDQTTKRNATAKAKQSGKPLWASEEWSRAGGRWGDDGALYVARLINKLYIRDRITKVEFWCPLDSIYDSLVWGDTGIMQADQPWSGHYTVWPAVWAVAHTTQFVEPGWRFMDGACDQFDAKTWRGSHIALRDPHSGDWSLIMVTGAAVEVAVRIAPGLKSGPVHLWKSTEAAQFVQAPDPTVANGQFTLYLEPNAIYSVTTTTGQQKGNHAAPPAKPFPFPFRENFDADHAGATPRFFSDQKGTFEIVARSDGGHCLAQIVPAAGTLWTGEKMLKPYTVFGDGDWRDYTVAASVRISGGDVEIGARFAGSWEGRDKLGYRWILRRDGTWQLNWELTTLAQGKLERFDADAWHRMKLSCDHDRLRGFVDGALLAEVHNASHDAGMAFIASTYDRNLFDDIEVTAP